MQTEEQVILVSWSSIARACGVSVPVMKRWAKRYGMPYVRLCGKVTIPRSTLVEWVQNLCLMVSRDGGGEEGDKFVLQKLKNLGRIK